MFRPAILAALLMLAPAAMAQTPFEMPPADDGLRGTRPGAPAPAPLDELFGELLNRAQPHLDGLARDMGGLLGDYAPVLDELKGLMDDIGNYDMPPERLPNGDILIRRKAGAPPAPPIEQLPNLLPKGPAEGQAPLPGNLAPAAEAPQVEL